MNNKYKEIVDYAIDYKKNNIRNYKRVGVAVIDTGVFLHPDIRRNVVDFYDCVNGRNIPYDNNGHGTHVSGIIAGNGHMSKNMIAGLNSDAAIIGIKVLNQKGNGKIENVLRGLEYIVKNKEKYNIRILNISIGGNDNYKDADNIALIDGVEMVWSKGIVVVAAAGNNGPDKSTITAPGVSRKIITVGSSDDLSMAGNQTSYSGRGPTCRCVIKPDILCVGNKIPGLSNTVPGYVTKSGTSMSTPIISGAISILLEKHPDMTPKDIKIALKNTSTDLGISKNIQGYGELNIKKLLSV